MADDIKVPDESAGAGPDVATDEIAGRHYQLVKPAFGADGAATLVDETHGLPVATGLDLTLTALAAAAAAIQSATEALNAKAVALNTGAVTIAALPASSAAPAIIQQDYATNGPLIVTPDTGQQWPVTAQGRGTDGVVRDLLTTPKGELIASAPDHVIYNTIYTGTPVAGSVWIGPIPAQGFVTAAFAFSAQPTAGVYLQCTMNGVDWIALYATYNAGAAWAISAWQTNAVYTAQIPPCLAIRLMSFGAAGALTATKFSLSLSKTPIANAVAATLTDTKLQDATLLAGSGSFYPLSIGGADSQKRARVFAADSTVNVRRQGATHTATGATLNLPFYGDVLATAIARIAAQPYNADQPVALQANTRGELSIDTDGLRRNQEQQQLLQDAVLMQSLDPSWGFELR